MKSRSLLSFCFLIALLGCFVWWMFPLVATTTGGLSGLLTTPQEITSGPRPWVFFVLAICFFVSLGRGTPTNKQQTYGSARYATRRDTRSLRISGQLAGRLLHLLAFLVTTIWQRVKRMPPQAQQATISPAAFLVGKLRGHVIALQEKAQEEHTLDWWRENHARDSP